MTLYEWAILIHCHVCPTLPPKEADAPIWPETRDKMIDHGLIEYTELYWQATAKGKAMIRFIEQLPYPQECWQFNLPPIVISADKS